MYGVVIYDAIPRLKYSISFRRQP